MVSTIALEKIKRQLKENMRTTLWKLAVLAGTGLLLASSPAANAALETYDLTFTGSGGMDATGTITVDTVNQIATSGSISVTGAPIEATPTIVVSTSGTLLADPNTPNTWAQPNPTSVRDHDGDDEIYDNLVNLGNDPILTGNGLGFAAGQYAPQYYETIINLWGNGPGSYSLYVAESQLDANGNVIGDPQWVYDIQSGSLTLTSVPEPATYGAIAGAGMLLVSLGRQLRRKQA
jgi:hypothetical protein